MKTHFFHLAYLDKETKKEENKNYFDINQNGTSIFNMKFSSKYNFDGIFPISGYFECNKHLISNDSANYNYIVYGYNGSGKSTLLRGERKTDNSRDNQGIMLKIVNETYNKMFDAIENKGDVVVMKFGAFGIDLCELCSDDNDDEEDCVKCLMEKNKTNKNKPNYFDQIVIGNNSNNISTSSIYSNVNLNHKVYLIKHIRSFVHLREELEYVITKKDSKYHNKKSYCILYHFSIELKNKQLESIKTLNLNFYEINCTTAEILQQFLLRINTRSTNENDILTKLSCSNKNQTDKYINILCMKNLSFDSMESTFYLKIIRFLELTYERNDLYENSNEICEHCCLLNEQLISSYKQQEMLLNQIKEMTIEANNIYSIVRGIKQYQKNTLNSDK